MRKMMNEKLERRNQLSERFVGGAKKNTAPAMPKTELRMLTRSLGECQPLSPVRTNGQERALPREFGSAMRFILAHFINVLLWETSDQEWI
jgi:hypothetical protein